MPAEKQNKKQSSILLGKLFAKSEITILGELNQEEVGHLFTHLVPIIEYNPYFAQEDAKDKYCAKRPELKRYRLDYG